MHLCGLGIAFENDVNVKEKVASNRIHQQSMNLRKNIKQQGPLALLICLGSVVDNCQGIIRSVDTGIPKDVNNQLIDRKIVKEELISLAKDLKIIHHAITTCFKISEKDGKLKVQSAEIDALASTMIFKALTKYDQTIETMLLLGFRYDAKSTLRALPFELVELIFAHLLNVKLEATYKSISINRKHRVKRLTI